MQEPLSVAVRVEVKDATGAVVYAGDHEWSGMSEASEVALMAALNNAVTDLGAAKAQGKGQSK